MNQSKNIILLIYKSDVIYDKMLELQRRYINSNPAFKAYFILLDPAQKENIKIINDMIYVRGEESLLNIMFKTLESFRLLIDSNINFNFIIRTNMSTIINLFALDNFLKSIPQKNIYCGGHILNLQWLDPINGIIDQKYFGLNYVQGTSIILSKDMVEFCLKHQDLFNLEVIDDVSFGIFFQKYKPQIYNNITQHNASFAIFDSKVSIKNDIPFIRFCTSDRNKDILNMQDTVQDLYNI